MVIPRVWVVLSAICRKVWVFFGSSCRVGFYNGRNGDT